MKLNEESKNTTELPYEDIEIRTEDGEVYSFLDRKTLPEKGIKFTIYPKSGKNHPQDHFLGYWFTDQEGETIPYLCGLHAVLCDAHTYWYLLHLLIDHALGCGYDRFICCCGSRQGMADDYAQNLHMIRKRDCLYERE